MKRSEIFRRVWSESLVQVAKKLGISDVGLTKLCRRLDIPVPAMGHWARAPGRRVPQPQLPDPTRDPDIAFPEHDAQQRQHDIERVRIRRKHAAAADQVASTLPAAAVPAELVSPHPLVRKTAAFFVEVQRRLAKIEARSKNPRPRGEPVLWDIGPRSMFGRYSSNGDGRLHIAASLGQVDWILRFHDGLLQALRAERMVAVVVMDGRKEWMELHKDRQALRLSFVEAFDKVPAPDGRSYPAFDYRPKDLFKLRAEGRTFRKEWAGSQVALGKQLPVIVAELLQAPAAEAAGQDLAERERIVQQQADAIAAAEAARLASIEAARKAAEALRVAGVEARAAQWHKAVAAVEEQLRIERVLRYLSQVDAAATELPPAERSLVESWSALVRQQASERDPVRALLSHLTDLAAGAENPLWLPTNSLPP